MQEKGEHFEAAHPFHLLSSLLNGQRLQTSIKVEQPRGRPTLQPIVIDDYPVVTFITRQNYYGLALRNDAYFGIGYIRPQTQLDFVNRDSQEASIRGWGGWSRWRYRHDA